MPKTVKVQECLARLENMGKFGEAGSGDLAYMQALALFAIVERLDMLNGIIAEIWGRDGEKTKRAQQKETP